jgi:hypothetical protein
MSTALWNDRFKNELRDRLCRMMANKIDRSMRKVLAWLESSDPQGKSLAAAYREDHHTSRVTWLRIRISLVG